jgi:hypothetical protein
MKVKREGDTLSVKIISKMLGFLPALPYLYYVMRTMMMNEINSLLLDERYDEIIMEGMMYQPWNQEMKIIPYNGKDLEESIYDLLSEIETFNDVKL